MQYSQLELRVLLAIASKHEERESLLKQVMSGDVSEREYTGVGFYSQFELPETAPCVNSWKFGEVPQAFGTHPKLDEGACFILWMKDGQIAQLEAYSNSGDWPEDESLFEICA